MTLKAVSPPEPFDPNEGAVEGTPKWPVYEHAYSAADYANFFMEVAPSSLEQFAKSLNGDNIRKGVALPPSMQSFATFSTMPETQSGGVLQVPGIPPESLRKIVRENVAPAAIINLRCSDVQRYSTLSTHPWKPGWRIGLRSALKRPTEAEKKDIQDAECFILNCNAEFGWDARKRDAAQLTGFARFLDALTRDSLTYDGMSVWTDMDLGGRVKAFKVLSTYNIRLATREGYKGNTDYFAVAVDEAGNVIKPFTRDELVFYTRNTRADADIGGYGYSEIEQGIKLIQNFSNAVETAGDIFNRNAVPNGILTAKGMFTQRQLDLLGRMWSNLKKGVTKSWALPVVPIPKDGELSIMDLTKLNGNDVRQQDFMNMMAGLFCAIYKFPVNRLGYRTSGAGPENTPTSLTSADNLIDESDPGMAPLLQAIEHVLNEYILWTRWPHLQFSFTGKSPKEDARETEFRANSMTWGEKRAAADMPKSEVLAKDPEQKLMAMIMDMCPVDPSFAGVYQNIASAFIKAKMGDLISDEQASPEATFPSKRDPAISAQHGHVAGIRRDSAAESKK